MQNFFIPVRFIPDRLQAGVTATVQLEPGKNGENLHPHGLFSALSSSYESGVAQIVDEDLVDEAVLSEGLDHHHPLSPELQQALGDVQRLKQCITSESTPVLGVGGGGVNGYLF